MRRALITLSLLAAAACARNAPAPAAAPSGGIKDPETLLSGVPDDALAVVVFAGDRPLLELPAMFLDAAEAARMRDDLAAFLRARTGLELADVRAGAVFIGEKGGGAILRGVKGEVRGKGPGDLVSLDGQIYAARHGDALVIGSRDAVHAALAVLDGKAHGFAETRKELVALMNGEGRGAMLVAGVDLARAAPLIPGPPVLGGLQAGVLVAHPGGLRAVVVAPEAQLQMLSRLLRRGLDELRAEGAAEKDRAVAGGDLGEAAAAIVVAHHLEFLSRVVAPKVSGERMVLELPLPLAHVGSAVPLIGIMSAVAIPAFMKNARKAKTSEGIVGVKKLYDGARSYYEEEEYTRGSNQPLPKQFPRAHVGPTPRLGECCRQGGKCAPDPTLWTDATWQALRFSMDDPHYYSYEYTSNGKEFSVDAYGDLNCNGVYSTFEMVGSVQADGTVTGQAGLFKDKELE